jgi:phosphate transport system permease protein
MNTRWTVKVADRIAKFAITVGGIGTILAVSGVFLFLVAVVIPIFMPGDAEQTGSVAQIRTPDDNPAIHMAVDEYRVMGWTLLRDGSVRVFRLDNGEILDETQAVNGDSLSAWSFSIQGDGLALGFIDGSIRLGEIGFFTDFPPEDQLPPESHNLEIGGVVTVGKTVFEKTPDGQYRRQRLEVNIDAPLPAVTDTSIVLLDFYEDEDGSVVCAYSADGFIHLNVVEQFENLLTGDVEYELRGTRIDSIPGGSKPHSLVVAESGTTVLLLQENGDLTAYDTRDFKAPKLLGQKNLTDGNSTITVFETLLGGTTFLTGDIDGRVTAWFQHKPDDEDAGLFAFSPAHRMGRGDDAVTAITPSPRSRVFAVGYDSGRIIIYQATSEAEVIDIKLPDGEPIEMLCIAPKNDGIIALTRSGLSHWSVDQKHPEVTLKSLFLPMWYEGYKEAAHVWQSSSGTDDFEPKFGLWPLIFGTLKATFYSMLFGVPLALLAAIFTSEFLSPAVKPRVKTLIESMASLPSVVLGFLAALVFAPLVQRVVPAAMVGFIIIPGSFLSAAYLWQLLPQDLSLRLARFRLWFLLALLPISIFISARTGPWIESLFFEGDIILWLDGQKGSGFGGWFLMLLPLAAATVVWFLGTAANDYFARLTQNKNRKQVALLDLGRFVFGAMLTILISLAVSAALSIAGADPRGAGMFMDTYVQRNALIVGFVMGFAIIPIIYTIAEDALSSVPDHLRAASLGAGATQWQTAIRIVLPTAMSGLFTAIMIGLGRAVGETMIVLMAAGNTPILDMNIFNGFRTLSANIAVELPEAVRNSTHYRTLFLAALILFSMTFTINTLAETIRLRFRKRSSQI